MARSPTRLSWQQVWSRVAGTMSERSRCSITQVGAVVVDANDRVVATGYNGPPARYSASERGDCDEWCPRARGERTQDYGNCVSVHAEANALLFCDRRDREEGTVYVTTIPCWECAKLIANSGLRHVVYGGPLVEHRMPDQVNKLLQDSGVTTQWVP